MAILLPFQALRYVRQPETVFIPGEDPPLHIDPALLLQDPSPALFLYEQRFESSVRIGLMGLLNRDEATVFPHEATLTERVEACRREPIETGSLFLWCRDQLPLPVPQGPPLLQVTDRFDCTHTVWRMEHLIDIAPQPLFLADGHHRYAAGWNLATIQFRTPALLTHAVHRLVFDDIALPQSEPIEDLRSWCAGTRRGHVRFGVVTRGEPLRGIELPHDKSERNVAVLHRHLLGGHATQPIRSIEAAMDAVQSGAARMAFLMEAIPLDKIEIDAARGMLMPPRSTDFYPKLAGGLIMHRHQNDSVIPPVAQRRGVRNPSS